jgi:hypothetical protein
LHHLEAGSAVGGQAGIDKDVARDPLAKSAGDRRQERTGATVTDEDDGSVERHTRERTDNGGTVLRPARWAAVIRQVGHHRADAHSVELLCHRSPRCGADQGAVQQHDNGLVSWHLEAQYGLGGLAH